MGCYQHSIHRWLMISFSLDESFRLTNASKRRKLTASLVDDFLTLFFFPRDYRLLAGYNIIIASINIHWQDIGNIAYRALSLSAQHLEPMISLNHGVLCITIQCRKRAGTMLDPQFIMGTGAIQFSSRKSNWKRRNISPICGNINQPRNS